MDNIECQPVRAGRKARIVTIDDRHTGRRMLDGRAPPEYDVVAAGHGVEAVTAMQDDPPDAVLLDLGPAGLDSFTRLAHLKLLVPRIPVICVADTASVEVAVQAMKAGAYEYLTRPVDAGQLRRILTEVITMRPVIESVAAQSASATVVCVGKTHGMLAALKVALPRGLHTEIRQSVAEALPLLETQTVEVVVVSDALPEADAVCLQAALRHRSSRSSRRSVVIGDAPHAAATVQRLRHADLELTVVARPTPSSLCREVATALRRHRGTGRRIPRWSRHVTEAIDTIAHAYSSTWTLTSLAQVALVSDGHLRASFRAEIDMAVMDYLRHVRIEVAKCLLNSSDQKLDAIADAVGLNDASHLSRVFSRLVGQRPGGFRRSA